MPQKYIYFVSFFFVSLHFPQSIHANISLLFLFSRFEIDANNTNLNVLRDQFIIYEVLK